MSTSTAIAGSWSSLPTPLSPWILQTIQSMGHTQMTPVQASTIPLFMKHKDVVVEAVTGSGKTLAFVIPVLERLARREIRLRKEEIGALVISPTRELATQIHSVFSLFLNAQTTSRSVSPREETQLPMNADHAAVELPPPLLLISSDNSSQLQDIQRFLSTGADIIVGTPGRVEEFLLGKGRGASSVKELEVLVLDEADRLLDLGFQTTLTRILSYLPKQRRTGLFSATMTDAISELVRVGLRNPARIVVKVQSKISGANIRTGRVIETGEGACIEERRIPANLENFYLTCRASEKLVQLVRIVEHEVSQCHSAHFIVYFATCACVDHFYRVLQWLLPASMTLYSLHGHLPPASRTRTLNNFASSPATPASPSILLTTDVAARGLDLPHVDVIIQFDPPSDPKTFSHRCGRTARAGRSGRAWILLVGREEEYVDFLAIRKIPLNYRPQFTISTADEMGEETSEDTAVTSYLTRIREVLLSDRALHDKSMKAFVSYVRAYSMHEASYIFRVKDQDLIGVAKCFGLLRLPKMPELKNSDQEGWEDAHVNWPDYAYKDKAQETKRRETEAIVTQEKGIRSEDRAAKKKRNTSWSQQTGKKEEKQKRKEKRTRKVQWQKTQGSNGVQETTNTRIDKAKRGRTELETESRPDSEGEWEELAREERMAKKLRRGEIDQATFDKEFGNS